MNIVLLEPEIPDNAGNIIRTCAAANTALHLIRPLGFLLGDKHFKRAGMDYSQLASIKIHDSFNDFMNFCGSSAKIFFATTKSLNKYTDVRYTDDAYIMFGKESAGIPEEVLKRNSEFAIRIPMANGARSLNLANSVAVVLYEALRQNGFEGLETAGRMRDGSLLLKE